MQSVFSHIATFQYFHEYHARKSADIFQLKIPKETQKILSNLNLIIKPFESGFHLLSGNSSLLLNELKPLRFHFQVKDPLFWNYTELEGFYPQKNLIFHSNLFQTLQSESNGITIDQDALYTIHRGKNFPFDQVNFQNTILFDEFGNSIAIDQNDPQVNGIEEEVGFTLTSDTDAKRIYIFPNQLFMLPDMVFALHPTKLFEDYQSNSPVPYQINFKARATKWRYFLADQYFNKKPLLGIKDLKNEGHTFTEKQLDINGLGTMRCFESDQEILLQEPASVDFQLIEYPDLDPKNRNIIIKHLPVASPESIHQENSSPRNFYSHIYI